MGMAASQARFLMLTARKSNVEYEGQQVNQERTALANESANLYNQLSSIKVPTPPATSDYYETVYTFKTSELDNSKAGSTEYTLKNIYSTPDGTFAKLSYLQYQWETALTTAYSGDITKSGDKYSVSLANGVIKDAVKYSYVPSQTEFLIDHFTEVVDPVSGDKSQTIDLDGVTYTLSGSQLIDDDGNSFSVKKNSDGTYSVSITVNQNDDDSDPYFYIKINGVEYKVSDSDNDGIYTCESFPTSDNIDFTKIESDGKYVKGKYTSPDGNANSAASYLSESFLKNSNKYNQPILAYTLDNQTYFISAAELQRGDFSSSTYVQSVGHPKEVDYPCTYSTASTGRYQTVTITDEYDRTHEFSLNVTTVQDEQAYEQAMLDYEYDQARYSQQVKAINAKTEKLQQEDRTLELRLKQLDTEQNAIKTEMDAVQKVIEDNVEATFKTFA